MALREDLKKQGDFLFRYRSYLPLVLLICGLALLLAQKGNQAWMEDPAIFVSLLGLAIRVHAVGFSAENTSGRNTEGQVAKTLNTKGLYSITRNPLYLGNYFMWLGIAMLTCNLWFVGIFTLVFWIYYERIVFAEEEFLREKFGDAYLKWAAETPIFIPFKPRWQRSASPFRWRRVLKREKNILPPLFLVFLLFDILSTRISSGTWTIEKTWLLVMAIIAMLSYILIKLFKRRF